MSLIKPQFLLHLALRKLEIISCYGNFLPFFSPNTNWDVNEIIVLGNTIFKVFSQIN